MIRGYVQASHFPPTVAVTAVVTTYGWGLGWRGAGLLGVFLAVLLSQLSVGWSNDAFDAPLDARAGRVDKPTVTGLVSTAALWVAALVALGGSAALSWLAAGWHGGSFLVLATAMAWLYNISLSRTVLSWLPYATAFGAVPLFLTYGLDGSAPAPWTVAVFATVGVSAHLANALPDLESDRTAGLSGLTIRLGRRRATHLAWILLGLGSAVLAFETARNAVLSAPLIVLGFLAALAYGSRARGRQAMFHALVATASLDVLAVALVSHRASR